MDTVCLKLCGTDHCLFISDFVNDLLGFRLWGRKLLTSSGLSMFGKLRNIQNECEDLRSSSVTLLVHL